MYPPARLGRMRWAEGAVSRDDVTVVMATRMSFERRLELVRVVREALKLHAAYGRQPGCGGGSFAIEWRKRRGWTLSGWASPGDLERFLRGAEHREYTLRYRRTDVRPYRWMVERGDFRPHEAWEHAFRGLSD